MSKFRLLVYKKLIYECNKNIEKYNKKFNECQQKQKEIDIELNYIRIQINIKKKQKEIKELKKIKEKQELNSSDNIEDNFILIN